MLFSSSVFISFFLQCTLQIWKKNLFCPHTLWIVSNVNLISIHLPINWHVATVTFKTISSSSIFWNFRMYLSGRTLPISHLRPSIGLLNLVFGFKYCEIISISTLTSVFPPFLPLTLSKIPIIWMMEFEPPHLWCFSHNFLLFWLFVLSFDF